MKRALFLILVAGMILSACASMEVVKDPSIVRIIDTGKQKAEAFDLSMRWLAQSFKSAKAVIEYSDKEVGTINGKGVMTVPGGVGLGITYNMDFSLIIDVKDSKSRLSLTAYNVYGTNSIRSPVYQNYFDSFSLQAEDMFISYEKFLKASQADW